MTYQWNSRGPARLLVDRRSKHRSVHYVVGRSWVVLIQGVRRKIESKIAVDNGFQDECSSRSSSGGGVVQVVRYRGRCFADVE